MEDKRICQRCGAELHDEPYVMSLRSERPLISPYWALVILAALLVVILAVAR